MWHREQKRRIATSTSVEKVKMWEAKQIVFRARDTKKMNKSFFLLSETGKHNCFSFYSEVKRLGKRGDSGEKERQASEINTEVMSLSKQVMFLLIPCKWPWEFLLKGIIK